MINPQSHGNWPRSGNARRAFLKTIIFSMILMASGVVCPRLSLADNAMKLTIVNQSGYPDDQVYFIMICQSPLGYLDFQNHVLVPTPSFSLNAAAMTATLAQLKEYSGDGTCSIPCPAMGSSRIYFCFGQNFDQMGGFSASGPEMGSSNPIPWAMFEVNLSGGKFLNQSNVDFFSIAYTLAANPGSGGTVTVGIPTASEIIFSQFEAIPSPTDSAQQNGNTDVFKALIVRNSAGEVIRVISPKAAALGYVNSSASLPQMFTHFLDDYVNNYCWKPGRTFSFSSKLASDPATYYGKVSPDGLTLSIYTDAAMTIPYTVPSLPRPSNAWGSPDFINKTYLWHNVGATSAVPGDIDWGYLLYGQDGYPGGPGAYWITDPVAMAIPVSIVRGVMHMDNGTVDWKDSLKYYKGVNGESTSAFPIFYYAKILHNYGLAGRVYALSFDDIYGNDSGIAFSDPGVVMTIYPFKGASAVEPCSGDFDGDRLADPAVFDDQAGRWIVRLSRGGAYSRVDLNGFLGAPGSLQAVADYDGDLIADPAVYQETNGVWTLKFSRSDYSLVSVGGYLGDIGWTPVSADYDGDRLADPAVYQETTGNWKVKLSTAGYWLLELNNFAGGPGYSAFGADFDGDRLADPTLYNRADGTWIVCFSRNNYVPSTFIGLLGGAGNLPTAADYDGDGLADPAVMEPMTGDWSVMLSSADYLRINLPAFLNGM